MKVQFGKEHVSFWFLCFLLCALWVLWEMLMPTGNVHHLAQEAHHLRPMSPCLIWSVAHLQSVFSDSNKSHSCRWMFLWQWSQVRTDDGWFIRWHNWSLELLFLSLEGANNETWYEFMTLLWYRSSATLKRNKHLSVPTGQSLSGRMGENNIAMATAGLKVKCYRFWR